MKVAPRTEKSHTSRVATRSGVFVFVVRDKQAGQTNDKHGTKFDVILCDIGVDA